jgi:hypothetical protein
VPGGERKKNRRLGWWGSTNLQPTKDIPQPIATTAGGQILHQRVVQPRNAVVIASDNATVYAKKSHVVADQPEGGYRRKSGRERLQRLLVEEIPQQLDVICHA